MQPANQFLPIEDWSAPPPDRRAPARLFLPGNECLYQITGYSGGGPVTAPAAGPTGFAAPDQAPPPADHRAAAATRPTGADRAGAPGVRPGRRRNHDPAEQPRRQRTRAERAVEPGSGGPRVLSDDLLELQRLDTALDQLGHRLATLPERAAADDAAAELRRNQARLARLDVRLGELTAAVEQAEHDGAELMKHRERLEAQLKTVIAPREAEALMHELDTLAAQRDTLDDTELELLEEQSQVLDDTAAAREATPALEAARDEAQAALSAVTLESDREAASMRAQRADIAARVGTDGARRLRAAGATTSTASPSPRSRAGAAGAAASTCRPASTSSWSPPRRRDRSATARSAARASLASRRLGSTAERARSSCSLWFVSTAVLTVWFVFRDPRFDYRLLIVGSVLPDLDGLFGGRRRDALRGLQRAPARRRDGGDRGPQAGPPAPAGVADRHLPAPRVRRCVDRHATCSGGRSVGPTSGTPALPSVAARRLVVPVGGDRGGAQRVDLAPGAARRALASQPRSGTRDASSWPSARRRAAVWWTEPRGGAGVLILVRHGRTALNAAGKLQGRIDEPLDEVGREQARRVAALVGRLRRADQQPAAACDPDGGR